ncbi:unnamed protein product [Euphydryas editha]|uniref:Uncharacterized protein n=1 Tax=Euphydryas editha TaxID=104508 RepID=A0AAU9U0L7_EUPED|nr:unnamed protein product [Euphydryas editha]
MRCTGVYPFNPLAIPDYFFCIDASSNEPQESSSSNRLEGQEAVASTSGFNRREMPSTSLGSPYTSTLSSPSRDSHQNVASSINTPEPLPEPTSEPSINDIHIRPDSPSIINPDALFLLPINSSNPSPEPNSPDARPGPSISIPNETSEPSSIESQKISYCDPKISDSSKSADEKKETPSKVLKDIRPIPIIPQYQVTSRKQKTTVLTSPEFMAKKTKLKENKQTQKTTKEKENHGEHTKKKKQVIKNKRKIGNNNQRKIKKKKRQPSYSSESQEEDIKIASSSDQTDVEENACVECLEDYNITKRQVDWIQCTRCLKWLHEDCTMYNNLCNKCGRYNVRQQHK